MCVCVCAGVCVKVTMVLAGKLIKRGVLHEGNRSQI